MTQTEQMAHMARNCEKKNLHVKIGGRSGAAFPGLRTLKNFTKNRQMKNKKARIRYRALVIFGPRGVCYP